MKRNLLKVLCVLMTLAFLMPCFAACGNNEDNEDGTGTKGEQATTADTLSAQDQALADLDEIDWGGNTFAVLHMDGFKSEVWGENGVVDPESGDSQVINDAVYQRNSILEDMCKLTFDHVEKDAASVETAIRNEASAPTGDFQLIDYRIGTLASLALQGFLYNFLSIGDDGIDIDQPWWDSGTADFCLEDSVYFMTGDVTFADDNVTYVLIFNKAMQRANEQTVPNPYDTVKAWDWTLEYFNNVIQGVSYDSNGDGKFNELDTYGFITTWEYGNTFFIGSDLRYIINDRTEEPYLALDESASQMEKALTVLDLSKKIYHANNASYMSPGGSEALGLTAFKENRGLFYGEVAQYLRALNAEMDTDFGVLPVPKYDHNQEFYRTWTHGSGSGVGITAGISAEDAELVANTVEAYAILASKYVKPAYYDIMLTSRNIRDAESGEMLDLIFQNRVFDMGFFFDQQFGLYPLFKTAVNDNTDKFSSSYAKAAKTFDRKLQQLVKQLANKKQ